MPENSRKRQEYRALISLEPHRLEPRHNLGAVLLRLGRLDEAKAIFEHLIAKNADDINVHVSLYRIAYARKDAAGVQRELEWAAGKPDEFRMIQEQSERDLGEGKLERAGELLRHANDLAARRNLNREVARRTALLAAYRALLGDCHSVREHVASPGAASPELRMRFATPLALCGYTRQAQGLIEDARAHFPKDTLIQAIQIPLVSAAIAIHDANPEAAIKSLQSAVPYENGYPGPIYLRGVAYLQASRLPEAATEFQKIVRQADVFTAEPIRALAHVQLGRAYVLQGDMAKLAPPIRISSRCGKAPTPTSPSSSPPKQNMQSWSGNDHDTLALPAREEEALHHAAKPSRPKILCANSSSRHISLTNFLSLLPSELSYTASV